MDQLNGVRDLVDRLGLPPRLKILVASMEQKRGPINEVGETAGANEVRQITGMVDGQNLLGCIVATLLNEIEVPDEVLAAAKPARQASARERWLEAADAFPDGLVLLLVDGNYVAFGSAGERIAAELDEHLVSVGRDVGVLLPLKAQASWIPRLVDKGLDVLLVEESSDDDGTARWSFTSTADYEALEA